MSMPRIVACPSRPAGRDHACCGRDHALVRHGAARSGQSQWQALPGDRPPWVLL